MASIVIVAALLLFELSATLCFAFFILTIIKGEKISDKIGSGISLVVSVLCTVWCFPFFWLFVLDNPTQAFLEFVSTTFLYLCIAYAVLSVVLVPVSSILHYKNKSLAAWIIKFIPVVCGALLPVIYFSVAKILA